MQTVLAPNRSQVRIARAVSVHPLSRARYAQGNRGAVRARFVFNMSNKIALGLVTDLFFRSKLDAVAEPLGVEMLYAATLEAAGRHCAGRHPALIFADLSDAAFPAAATVARLRADAPQARIVGFASHVDLKALKAAREAGFDLTLSRSEFTARLAELLTP